MPIPDQLKTIVVVMLENRSFDHVFGYLSLPQYGGRTDVNGLIDPATNLAYANDYEDQGYQPFEMPDQSFTSDMPHRRGEVRTQLAFRGRRATMSGFVQAYVDLTHSVVENPPVMGYLPPSSVFMSDFFAREYLICDRWFAPLPADTHPNRAVAFSGCSLVDDTKGRLIPYQDLVFEWLTKRDVRWRVYHPGLSFFLLFGQFDTPLTDNYRDLRKLAVDLQTESANELPQVIFIEPEYQDSPVHFNNIPNDNHPPLAVGPGETFLHDIYATLSSSPRWPHMALIVTYDEHGGFFDHVPPLPIKSGLPAKAQYRDPFTTTGVRVPAMIASPFVPRGQCSSRTFDHTSILQFFAESFAGGTNKYSKEVTARLDQGIESLSALFSRDARTDVPVAPTPPVLIAQAVPVTPPSSWTENQKAFALAGQKLLEHDARGAMNKFPELVHLQPLISQLSSPQPPPPQARRATPARAKRGARKKR